MDLKRSQVSSIKIRNLNLAIRIRKLQLLKLKNLKRIEELNLKESASQSIVFTSLKEGGNLSTFPTIVSPKYEPDLEESLSQSTVALSPSYSPDQKYLSE